MRGEKSKNLCFIQWCSGSSPHARGKVRAAGTTGRPHRIIPACAGKSLRRVGPASICRDHPRMRGEKKIHATQKPIKVGSSPHARGKEDSLISGAKTVRIIPACAGKRPNRSANSHLSQDHPRMRGEKSICSFVVSSTPGSSPHARGKGSVQKWEKSKLRIIPACAGKSSTVATGVRDLQDHPRMRGDKYTMVMFRSLLIGSSPHARGKVRF